MRLKKLKKLQTQALLLAGLCLCTLPAAAQLSIGMAVPGVSIGINVPVFPRLVRVPGYPVYYDPQASSNYFFYDGLYWVLRDDTWYQSTWYNGPWASVEREDVPLFVLRVPVRYYRQPPAYFRGWGADSAPRWGDHWGPDWQRGHAGWDRWDRRNMPAVAPLPTYQRHYIGERYPQEPESQAALHAQQYRYEHQGPGAPPIMQTGPGRARGPIMEQGRPQGREEGPVRGPQHGPNNGPDRGPERGQDRGPDKGRDKH